MNDVEPTPPRRWEYVVSGSMTAALALAAMVSEANSRLDLVVSRLEQAPGWLHTLAAVPVAVWWALTAAAGVLLFWAGVRLTRRWSSFALLLPPAAMLALQYLIPRAIYAAVQNALPSMGGV